MDLAEAFTEYIVQRVLKNRAEELRVLERDTAKLEPIKGKFPRLHYREACEIIKKENPSFIIGDDFGARGPADRRDSQGRAGGFDAARQRRGRRLLRLPVQVRLRRREGQRRHRRQPQRCECAGRCRLAAISCGF